MALVVGFGLPGFADWLSRQRDAALVERIEGESGRARPPRVWSFTFDGRRYECAAEVPFEAERPVYRCLPVDR